MDGSRVITRQRVLAAAAGGVASALAACAGPGSSAPALDGVENDRRHADVPLAQFAQVILRTLDVAGAGVGGNAQEPIRDSTGATELLPQLVGGTGPDIFAACCASLPVWAQQGLVANLDPLLKRDGKEVPLADYSPALL